MATRSDLETAGAVVAVLIVGAFVVSFALGLRGTRETTAPPVPANTIQTPPRTAAGRVEVLNASGRSGLARAAMDQLRTAGFDVVFYGTASAERDTSIVLARRGDDGVARAAARSLDIRNVRTQIDTTLYLDATVIVGRDWRRE
jgi:hypothetical protein